MLLDPTLRIPLEALPVFPLANTVLLPDQQLPLHIFEPRYRQMIRDVLDGAPYMVVALVEGDPAQEPSRIARIATAGRVVTHQRLSDGRFNVLLEGTVRVELEEIASDRLYRRVKCTALTEPQGDEAEVPSRDRAAMMSLVGLVMQHARRRSPGLEFTPPAGLTSAALAMRVADRLVTDAAMRQSILEAASAHERVERTTTALAHLLGEASERAGDRNSGAPS